MCRHLCLLKAGEREAFKFIFADIHIGHSVRHLETRHSGYGGQGVVGWWGRPCTMYLSIVSESCTIYALEPLPDFPKNEFIFSSKNLWSSSTNWMKVNLFNQGDDLTSLNIHSQVFSSGSSLSSFTLQEGFLTRNSCRKDFWLVIHPALLLRELLSLLILLVKPDPVPCISFPFFLHPKALYVHYQVR